MAMAVSALMKGCQPHYPRAAGSRNGRKTRLFAGDMYAKGESVSSPSGHDALFDMMDMEQANRLIDRETSKSAPLAFMRGRTLNDSFVILGRARTRLG